ncbi:MAG: glycosyltransferase [Crocinitomicaceae bacterium]
MNSENLKYWLCTTEFPPIHGGGISTYCYHTANMLKEKGHEVSVFIYEHGIDGIHKEVNKNGIQIIKFDPDQSAIKETLGFEALLSWEFARVIEQCIQTDGRPDVIEFQDYLGIGYYALQKKQLGYAAFKDLKILLTLHAPVFLYYEYNQVPLYQFPEYWICEMEKSCIRQADLVISPSQYLLDQLKDRMVMENLQPVQLFNPYLNEWSDGQIQVPEKGDICFFGKLTPQKGAIELLAYFKKLWDEGFDQPLNIIGGGKHFFYPFNEDLQDHLKKKYKAYIDKNLIRFEGNLAPDALKTRLQKARVIIVPSIVDNLPYAVLEAMSLGKMVLASENGGHTEILKSGENGFIFSHQIKGDFETKLKTILNLGDADYLRICENASKSVQHNTNYETIYQAKKKLIDQLLNGSGKGHFEFNQPISKQAYSKEVNFEKGLLSIVVPYYNMGEYIEETLESLQKIDYPNKEILVIDDGSNKEQKTKIKILQSKYDFQLISKENEGLALTRNFGAEQAKGEYIAFLDSDDTVTSDYYSKAIQCLQNHPEVGFVGCWAQYFEGSKGTWPTFNPEPPYLLTHNMINSSAIVVRKKDFLNFGLNDAKMIYGMEDYDSIISMVKNGVRGVVLPEFLWNYRIRKDSMQQSFTVNKQLMLYREISKKHKEFYNQYGCEIANILNHNGSGIFYQNPTLSNNKLKLKLERLFGQKTITLIKKNRMIREVAKKIYRKFN